MLASKYQVIPTGEYDQLFEKVKNWGRWGEDDERGALNYITPERTAAAAALVRSGRTVSMAIPIDKGAGPDNPAPAMHFMCSLHDTDTGSEGLGFATDFIGMQCHGDCHTHIDALCHLSYKGSLYNGVPASSVDVTGAGRLDITACAHGIIGRGVMIDVPAYRGVKWLEPGEAVTAEEIEAIEKKQGVRLGEGDIMVFRTGQYRRRLELGPWDVGYTGQGRAGLDPYCMLLLHERKVAAFLPEGDGEVVPSYVEGLLYPVHPLQITAMGMACADSLQLEELAAACEEEGRFEFMVAIAPLRLPKGTGGPFNPIAVF
ncbi:MAG: cyclase family protein [Clostridiales bacterium]|nr:cyclase family protein [Clostridiales bacterium]